MRSKGTRLQGWYRIVSWCAGHTALRSLTDKHDGQRVSASPRHAYSTTFTRSATSAAASKQPLASQPIPPQRIQALPEVQLDDLPIASMGDHKVAVGWDTRTWSRLCVLHLCLKRTRRLIVDFKSSYMVARSLPLSEMLPYGH